MRGLGEGGRATIRTDTRGGAIVHGPFKYIAALLAAILLSTSMSAFAHDDYLIVNIPGSLTYVEKPRGPGLLISYSLGGGIARCKSSSPTATTGYSPALLYESGWGLGGEFLQPVRRTFHMPDES